MEKRGKVQQKISCVFETEILNEPTKKRQFQGFRVVASDVLKDAALACDITNSVATEKLDGTCVYIAEFEGQPWLWARLDRKPNKAGENRFKQHQTLLQKWESGPRDDPKPSFEWNLEKDFKTVPEHWIPATDVPIVGGQPQPDQSRHIPGWVPVERKSRQYCWHTSAVDFDGALGLFLRQSRDCDRCLHLQVLPLRNFLGCTAELIGTNVNANTYNIGSKRNPLHFLVLHGDITLSESPELSLPAIKNWFSTQQGLVEGIVWHCPNGKLFKIHRHHLNLPWPLRDASPVFSQTKVRILLDDVEFDSQDVNPVFLKLKKHSNKTCEGLMGLTQVLDSGENKTD
ncbi:RNA ligase 1-like [Crassostrea virginica]